MHTTRISLGERLSGWVVATGQSVVNPDARLDLDEAVRDESPLRSALAVPVISNGRSAGVLSFYACEANAFDDTHRRLVAAAGPGRFVSGGNGGVSSTNRERRASKSHTGGTELAPRSSCACYKTAHRVRNQKRVG